MGSVEFLLGILRYSTDSNHGTSGVVEMRINFVTSSISRSELSTPQHSNRRAL